MIKSKFGQKMSMVLQEIEAAMLERNSQEIVIKPDYTDEGFRAGLYIFMDVLMDKMYSLQVNENYSRQDCLNMANKAGKDLSKLVHTYTGINTLDIYK